MIDVKRKTKTLEGCRLDSIPFDDMLAASEPVILKGLVREWDLVQKGLESNVAAMDYLKSFYNGLTVGVYIGELGSRGRYFYNDDLTGLNFQIKRLPLDQTLSQIEAHL